MKLGVDKTLEALFVHTEPNIKHNLRVLSQMKQETPYKTDPESLEDGYIRRKSIYQNGTRNTNLNQRHPDFNFKLTPFGTQLGSSVLGR